MTKTYKSAIKSSYVDLRSIYLPAAVLKETEIVSGPVTVVLAEDDSFSVDGTLAKHLVSGMAKLYRELDLKAGQTIEFSVRDKSALIIHSPKAPDRTESTTPRPRQTVFERMGLKYIHIEPFRAENLNNWEPETETDVYLAFGVLHEFTDYQYCCGTSKALLDKLGADYADSSKPDAILIDRVTGQYLMAEWKKHSSDFKANHRSEDVDVLVCWHDNELDRTTMPPRVLPLHAVAKKAGASAFEDE